MSRRPSGNARKRPRPGPIDLSGGPEPRPDGVTPGGFLDTSVNGAGLPTDTTPAGIMPHSAATKSANGLSAMPPSAQWNPQSPALAIMSPFLQQFLPGIFEGQSATPADTAAAASSSGGAGATTSVTTPGSVAETPNEGQLLKQLEHFADAFSSTMEKLSPEAAAGGAVGAPAVPTDLPSPITPSRRSARQASRLSEMAGSGNAVLSNGAGLSQMANPGLSTSDLKSDSGSGGGRSAVSASLSAASRGGAVNPQTTRFGSFSSLPAFQPFPRSWPNVPPTGSSSSSSLSTAPSTTLPGRRGSTAMTPGLSAILNSAMTQHNGRPYSSTVGSFPDRRLSASTVGSMLDTPSLTGAPYGSGSFTPIDLGSDALNRALGALIETTAQSPGFRELQQTPTGVSRFTKALEEELKRKKIFTVPQMPRSSASAHPPARQMASRDRKPPHIPPGATTADLDDSIMFSMETASDGSTSFKCCSCDHITKRKSDAKKHYRKHTGEKPYACSICGVRFSDPSTRSRHQKAHESKSGRLTCPVSKCGKFFVRKPQLKKHVQMEHPTYRGSV